MVPPVSHRVSRVQWYSGSSLIEVVFRLRDYHPLRLAFPYHSAKLFYRCVSPQPRRINPPVWPLPRSLATTSGISVDFSSSPYLDVSVQAVPHVRLFHSTHADRVLLCRVSPFGNLRIDGYLHLPEAYRSLSRPSSAPDAKAFPLRSFQLDLLSCEQERSRSGSHEFELCRLQSSLKLFVLPLKSSTKICCFPLLLALHTLVTLFSFQGAVLVSLETRFKHLAILNA